MKLIQAKTFQVPELKGISAKNIEEHLKLYAGYVKNANLILEHIAGFAAEGDKYTYEIAELNRKFSFEYNGIKNHEYYFAQLEGGSSILPDESALKGKIIDQWGSWETFMERFKLIATTTRGIGWAILYYDQDRKNLMIAWVDEQHLGHLNSAQFIFGIDMWEHSYVADYQPSGKKQYVEDYLFNVNWNVIDNIFSSIEKN